MTLKSVSLLMYFLLSLKYLWMSYWRVMYECRVPFYKKRKENFIVFHLKRFLDNSSATPTVWTSDPCYLCGQAGCGSAVLPRVVPFLSMLCRKISKWGQMPSVKNMTLSQGVSSFSKTNLRTWHSLSISLMHDYHLLSPDLHHRQSVPNVLLVLILHIICLPFRIFPKLR